MLRYNLQTEGWVFVTFIQKYAIFPTIIGMVVGTLVTIFIRPTCLGPLAGILTASYFAKISSPKEGAIIGSIVMIPIGLYAMFQGAVQTMALDNLSFIEILFYSSIGVLMLCIFGALSGLLIGKLFQLAKNNKFIF